jgi:phosphinothricin acetyltransferase
VAQAADGDIAGYAYARAYHPRAAYRWTCETAIYLAQDRRGRGIGGPLYRALLDALAGEGFVAAMALVSEPNAESTRFHAALGFERVGLMRAIGYKLGRWHDVGYWQRDLAPRTAQPAEPGTPG